MVALANTIMLPSSAIQKGEHKLREIFATLKSDKFYKFGIRRLCAEIFIENPFSSFRNKSFWNNFEIVKIVM